jgi:hypothetical protein
MKELGEIETPNIDNINQKHHNKNTKKKQVIERNLVS